MDREKLHQALRSEITRMELEIMKSIFSGHRAHDDDEFKLYRILLKTYRSILFHDE